MFKPLFMTAFLLFSALKAQMLIAPQDAMRATFGSDAEIEKKSILIDKAQAAAIAQSAKTTLSTKVYRAFAVRQNENIIGYAVLLNEKVRTKNAAVLYMINISGAIKAIEIVAFNEPPEYMPSSIWMDQLDGKTLAQELRVGKDIPTITGATMSARNIADGSRLALALYDLVLKP